MKQIVAKCQNLLNINVVIFKKKERISKNPHDTLPRRFYWQSANDIEVYRTESKSCLVLQNHKSLFNFVTSLLTKLFV